LEVLIVDKFHAANVIQSGAKPNVEALLALREWLLRSKPCAAGGVQSSVHFCYWIHRY